jgi:hypothetical protein
VTDRRIPNCTYPLSLSCDSNFALFQVEKAIPAEVSSAYLEFVDYAVNRPDEELLRARGYLIAGVLVQTTNNESFPTLPLLDRTIKAINDDESEVVKVACIKALQGFLKASGGGLVERQVPIAVAISDFLNGKSTSFVILSRNFCR